MGKIDNEFTLLPPLSLTEAVTKANMDLFEEMRGKMETIVCYRSNLHQAVTFGQNEGTGCKVEGSRAGIVEHPGAEKYKK